MYYKKPLVTTKEKMVKEGINYMEIKPNVVREDITPPIANNKIDAVNEIDKPQG